MNEHECDSCGEYASVNNGGVVCDYGVFCSKECAMCDVCPDRQECQQE